MNIFKRIAVAFQLFKMGLRMKSIEGVSDHTGFFMRLVLAHFGHTKSNSDLYDYFTIIRHNEVVKVALNGFKLKDMEDFYNMEERFQLQFIKWANLYSKSRYTTNKRG